jgi:molybdopterin-guanine dinucleotide biosynthesis protein A
MALEGHVALAVLAGGEGSRMGGPKGSLRVRGKPILEYLLEGFSWEGPTLVVTSPGRQRPAGAERFGREVVDPVAVQGPLRGVLTALEACTCGILVVLTVDMPGVGREQIRWLADRLDATPEGLGLMTRRAGGQIEPFPSAYRKQAAEVVRAHLVAERRSVHGLLAEPGFAAVDAPVEWGDETWENLNYPADLREFLNRTER